MSRMVSELRVFVASPDDVRDERGLLEETISKLNITWSNTLGLRLDLVKWETHCWPGVNTDAQANINEQINDNYDIFIGIMWKRFGTPTLRAGSGTSEEFQRAYERYGQDSNALRVMFYFKEAPPASMSEIDPEQWASVNDFRKQLGEKGVIYWAFKDSREFESLIQMHLSRQVQEWGKSWGKENRFLTKNESPPEASPNESIACDNVTDIDDEDGFLDLIELGTESFSKTKEIADHIAEAMNELGIKINIRSKEMDDAKVPTGLNVKKARRIGDHIADDIEAAVSRINTEIPLFSKSISIGINAWSRAAFLYTEFEDSSERELISAREESQSLRTALTESIAKISTFRNKIDSTPRLTRMFNRAKKHLVAVLDSLLIEMQSAANLTSEMEKVVDKAIEELQARKASENKSLIEATTDRHSPSPT